MNSLSIEKNKDILAQYGLAFAWLNSVEMMIDGLLNTKGKLYSSEQVIINRLLENKTFGYKISLLKDFIDPKLYEELNKLNSQRNILAHSPIGETINSAELPTGTGQFTMLHKGKYYDFKEESLQEIINLASEVSNKIYNIFKEHLGIKE